MKKHSEIRIAVAILSLLVAASARADQTVTIGLSVPLTGPQVAAGKDAENGARLAIQELNKEHPKIAGQPVTYVLDAMDDQADPRTGVQVAQRLVDKGVVAIVGPYNSGVAIPASRIYNSANVPMLSTASNPALTQQGFKNIFRIGASDSSLGGTMAQFAAKTLKVRTAAVVDDRTAYGQGVADEFEKVAKSNGIEIIDKEYTNSQASDFHGILTAIKAKNPDVIFYGGYDAQSAPMVKQMQQLGVRAKMLGGDSICTAQMGKVAGDAASAVYCAQGGVPPETTAAGRDYVQRYHATFHTDLQVYGVNYYDGVKLLADALARAGTTSDRTKIEDALAKTDYKGIGGTYSFASTGELQGAPTTVYVFRNGSPTPFQQ